MATKTKPNSQKKNKFQFKLRINLWQIVILGLLLLIFVPALLGAIQTTIDENHLELSQALTDIKAGKVQSITVENEKLTLKYSDTQSKVTTKEGSISFPELLERSGIDPQSVKYTVSDQTLIKAAAEAVSIILPVLLISGFFF